MAEQDDDIVLTNPTDQQSQSASTTVEKEKRKRKETSDVWNHFIKILVEGEDQRSKCKHCGKEYMAHSTKHGTNNMKRHIKVCSVLNAVKGAMDNYIITHVGEGSNNQMRQHKFDPKFIREGLVEWIVCDELPFMLVQSEKFKNFCKRMEPKFEVPSRVTIARDMFRLFKVQKEKLKMELKACVGRISLITDMWTSSNNVSYMCVTAHFIDKCWKLHKRIISFTMDEDHRGEGIGKQLEIVTKEWGINKIMCITLDNASVNDGAVDWMKRYGCNNLMGGDYLHVRCFAHILNIIVKFGLQKCIDSVERIRNAVKYVRSSPKRQLKFDDCARDVGVVITKSLCLDMATRWNSTLLMLEVAVEYRCAFDRMGDVDIGYINSFLSVKSLGAPTFTDWDNARRLIPFLMPFYNSTNDLSGSSYITISSYFSEFKAIRDHLSAARSSNNMMISQIANEMMVKYNAYFGNVSKVNMLVFVALVLDPRGKMIILKRGLDSTFEARVAKDLYDRTKGLLQDLYECYRSIEAQPSQIPSSSQASHQVTGRTSKVVGNKKLWDVLGDENEFDVPIERSELDKYLADDREIPSDDFDLLHYWKVMKGRFPTLASIARDIFAIPASTVASESAFSTGGRVITDRRSSLLPRTVEALVCTQSWLKNVCAIESNEVMIDIEAAEDVEKAAEEELDGGIGDVEEHSTTVML